MANFLLEIGTEEIPASYLAPAAEFLNNSFKKLLSEKRVGYKDIKVFFTPRRIAVLIEEIAERQQVWEEEVIGPPKKVAVNENGLLTTQGKGFLKTNKAKDFYVKETPKGEYLFIKKTKGGKETASLLKSLLPSLITSIPFPKYMRWQDAPAVLFARPIRWLCCLLGNRRLQFDFPNLRVSNFTFGNRYYQKKIVLKNPAQYEEILKEYKVIPSFWERRDFIIKELHNLAKDLDGSFVEDRELIDEVANTLEFPVPLLCHFDERYLSLPFPVITTVLKKHLRAFVVRNEGFLPYFLVFANNPGLDCSEVKGWYEKSARSRLEDAQFYFEEDLKKGLLPLVEAEKKVIWIEGLGSLYDKTQRLVRLGERLAGYCEGIDLELLRRASFLAKADLLTNMVREKELTSLQGIIGGIYASLLGEKEGVAQIIAEQYLPLPQTKEGAIFALADRLDNIVASFLKGEIPTGSYDPFGLKRMADTILEILSHHNLFIRIDEPVGFLIQEFNSKEENNLLNKILDFFTDRLRLFLQERGYRYDCAEACCRISPLVPKDSELRASALEKYRKERKEEFARLVIGQKRVANILREAEQKGIEYPSEVGSLLLIEEAEKVLYQKALELEPKLMRAVTERKYEESLSLLLSLREAIDNFFDKVLVMTEEIALKQNRLALLSYIKSLFNQFCDLSLIVLDEEK